MIKGIKVKDIRDFEKHCNRLVKLLEKIREYCPEAMYYMEEDGFCLLNGVPHSGSDKTHYERVVAEVYMPKCDSGAW